MVQISLGRVIVLVGIIIATLLYFVLPGMLQAEAEFCAATCQARKAGEDTTKTTVKSTSTTKAKCYGIYCDKDKDGDNDSIKKYENAIKNKNFIAIKISQTCQKSGTCPTIKELADTYDNSDKFLSGDFYFDENEQKWKRENPPIYNVFEIYKFMNLPWVVFVSPDDYTWDRSKKILIESQLRYVDNRDKIENQVRVEYEGLSMDGCKSATIGWMNNGSDILLDVLNHFYSNCKQPIEYDPRVEIFMNSTIFPGCDQDCFYFKEQFKRELKADHLISVERWEKENCKDDDDTKYTDLTSYDRNKDECDRIRASLDLDDDDDEPCYGIYCEDKRKAEKTEAKTAFEIRQERIKELEEIQQCKEDQIWDEERHNGSYRRLLFDCEDDEERQEYYDVVLCENEIYDDIKDSDGDDVNCYNEDDRKEKLKKIRKDIQENTPKIDLDVQECLDYVNYEMTLPDRRDIASIITCEDEDEREEYMQEMRSRYPEGIPEEYRTIQEPEEEEKVKCYGIHCDR